MIEQLVSGKPEQRPDDRAQRVHGAVKPERPPALGRLHAVDQQRVARRTAESLPQPVDDPPGQHPWPRAGGSDDELAQRRHPVAGRDQRAAGEPVAQRTRHELGERCGALRGAFHRARRPTAEHPTPSSSRSAAAGRATRSPHPAAATPATAPTDFGSARPAWCAQSPEESTAEAESPACSVRPRLTAPAHYASGPMVGSVARASRRGSLRLGLDGRLRSAAPHGAGSLRLGEVPGDGRVDRNTRARRRRHGDLLQVATLRRGRLEPQHLVERSAVVLGQVPSRRTTPCR